VNKKLTALLFVMTALALLVSSCGTPAQPTEVESAPPTDPTAATATPAVEPTKTPKPTKEPPKTGPLATAAALSAQVTLVPPTPIGGFDASGLTEDDYVGIVTQAWHIINANYVRDNFNGVDWDAVFDEYVVLAEDVTSSEELWELLADLVRELNDDHSRFVPPGNMEGEFGVGISGADDSEPLPWTGISVWPGPSREDEYFYAWDVCQYGAAADAGMVRGDVILAVDGEPLVPGEEGFTSEQVRAVVFGTGGDTVTLTVQSGPDEEPRDLRLPLGGGGGCMDWVYEIVSESPYIGYIRIADFDGDAADNIRSAIEEFEADKPLDGLILDVRHNPGGNSDDSAGIFADGIVGTEGPLREGEQRTTYRIRGVDWNDTTPLVVLTDGSSHSAADYFPAALKELDRATIIGMNSAGNTEGIISFGLADGTLIRLAVMTMALNDGTLLEGVGVTPHIEIPLGMWGLRQQPYDVQLQAAIDFLLGK
jgi:carboxyl-terminal processing protease